MPRFAANLSMMFGELPFLDRFAEAAQAGFRAVEFQFPYDYPAAEVAARAREQKLEIVLFNAPPGDFAAGDRGLAALPGREHEFTASLATAFRYGETIGCRRLHVMAGRLDDPDPEARRRCLRVFVRNLKLACEDAAARGFTLLIEPINPRDFPGYLLNRQDEAHAIVDEVGSPCLKVQMDFYHCQIVEGDLAETFRRFQPGIGHVQIAGVPGRHEPDVGEINYAYLFKRLDEWHYDGWVGCEYRPAGSTTAGLSWFYRLLDRKRASA